MEIVTKQKSIIVAIFTVIAVTLSSNSFAGNGFIKPTVQLENIVTQIVAQQGKQVMQELSASLQTSIADELSNFTLDSYILGQAINNEKMAVVKTTINVNQQASEDE